MRWTDGIKNEKALGKNDKEKINVLRYGGLVGLIKEGCRETVEE